MDDTRFDAIARSLRTVRSRRAVFRVMTVFAAGAALPGAAVEASSRRRRRRCPEGRHRCKVGKRSHSCVDFQTDPLNCGECGWRCERGTPCVAGVCVEIDPAPGGLTCPGGTVCALPPSYHVLPTCCMGNGFCATCIPGDECVCCPIDGGDCQYCAPPQFACCSDTNCVCCQGGQSCDETSGGCVG